MGRILIISASLIFLTALAFFGYFIFISESPEAGFSSESPEAEEQAQIVEELDKKYLLHWDHNELTYRISNVCGKYESSQIKRAFEEISESVGGVITFKEVNASEKEDLNITCSLIEDCYKEMIRSDKYYKYTTEKICSLERGITAINESEENIISHAHIEMVGFAGFAETDNKGQSGFSVFTCGYSIIEKRQILRALGFGPGYGYNTLDIYSLGDNFLFSNILNENNLVVGLSTYEAGDCSKYSHDIDPWIISEIISIYEKNETDLTKTDLFEECQELSSLDRQEWCHANISAIKKESVACIKISDPIKKDACYQNLALEIKDESSCLSINNSGMQRACFFKLALLKNSSELCEKIDEKDYWNSCKEQISNVSAANISDSLLLGCIKQGGEDLDLLEKMNLDFCFEMAISYVNNSQPCSIIRPESKEGPSKLTINQAKEYSKNCYLQAAYESLDYSICSRIEEIWSRDHCYWTLAKTLLDSSPCSFINTPAWKDYCERGTTAKSY